MKGWRYEGHRHALAAKGIHTSLRKSFMPVYIYRKSTEGKHKGNELDNEVRAMYKDKPLDHIEDNPIELYSSKDKHKREEMEMDYINDQVKKDKDKDIKEVRWTDSGDLMIMHLKRDKDGDLQSLDGDEDEDNFAAKGKTRVQKKEERLFIKLSKRGPVGMYEQAVVAGQKPKIYKKQLAKGIRTELEHTNDRKIAKHIALDHLTEDSKYYTKLERAGL